MPPAADGRLLTRRTRHRHRSGTLQSTTVAGEACRLGEVQLRTVPRSRDRRSIYTVTHSASSWAKLRLQEVTVGVCPYKAKRNPRSLTEPQNCAKNSPEPCLAAQQTYRYLALRKRMPKQ